MPGKRQRAIVDHNRIIRNSSILLISNEKFQEVEINNNKYLTMRDIGSILSKITGSTIDTISIAVLIARICNNKIILLSSGDSAKSDYFNQTISSTTWTYRFIVQF